MKVVIKLVRVIFFLTACSAFGQVSFEESFSDNSQGWPFLGQGDGYSISIEDGHLVLNGNTTAIQTFQKLPLTEETNFAISASFIFLNGDHYGWMGIRFMMNEDATKYCTFTFNNDKGFLIAERKGKKYEVIRESKSQVVKPYDYNSLTVVKKGVTYKFLINDKQVHEEKISNFYGPYAGVMTNGNMMMKVDEFQVYDPAVGKKVLKNSNRLTLLESQPLTALDRNLPPDFTEFLDQSAIIEFPYYFTPGNAQGVDVSNLPFVQKHFYKYVNSDVRAQQMWSMFRLGECADGYAVLMMNRYLIHHQDVSRFFVAIFSAKGELTQQKDIGMIVKENGDFFKVIDFKVYRDANVMNIEATETLHNGNKNKSSVRYNTRMCN